MTVSLIKQKPPAAITANWVNFSAGHISSYARASNDPSAALFGFAPLRRTGRLFLEIRTMQLSCYLPLRPPNDK